MPTIVWKAMRTTLTGGRCAAARRRGPATRALGSWKASSESILGIRMPNLTSPSRVPAEHVIGAPRSVSAQALERGELGRLLSATSRAAQSPTSTCTGEASAAIVSGIASAVRS